MLMEMETLGERKWGWMGLRRSRGGQLWGKRETEFILLFCFNQGIQVFSGRTVNFPAKETSTLRETSGEWRARDRERDRITEKVGWNTEAGPTNCQ